MPSHQMLLGKWCQWIHSTFNKVVVIIFCPLNILHTQLSFERNHIFGRAYCNSKVIYLNAYNWIVGFLSYIKGNIIYLLVDAIYPMSYLTTIYLATLYAYFKFLVIDQIIKRIWLAKIAIRLNLDYFLKIRWEQRWDIVSSTSLLTCNR